MIKAEDLRIGNLVTSKTWKGYHKVDGIELIENGFKVLVKGFWHEFIEGVFVDIEPIELNGEWFIKLGFEKVASAWCLDTFTLGTKTNEKSTPYFTTSSFLIEILTVHQLQNLYHSLTGTELTTKP